MDGPSTTIPPQPHGARHPTIAQAIMSRISDAESRCESLKEDFDAAELLVNSTIKSFEAAIADDESGLEALRDANNAVSMAEKRITDLRNSAKGAMWSDDVMKLLRAIAEQKRRGASVFRQEVFGPAGNFRGVSLKDPSPAVLN